MAPGCTEHSKLKEFDKWQKQEGPCDLPPTPRPKTGHKTARER